MNLTEKINADIKTAMLAKEKEKLEALRAVKAALLLAATDKGADGNVSSEAELKMLQKLVKQRKEAADIFATQGRKDLEDVERKQASWIEAYLPAQMSSEEIEAKIKAIIAQVGASGPGDKGKVIGAAMKELSGKADGKVISETVARLLS